MNLRKIFLITGSVVFIPTMLTSVLILIPSLGRDLFGENHWIINNMYWLALVAIGGWIYYTLFFLYFILDDNDYWMNITALKTARFNYNAAKKETEETSKLYLEKMLEFETTKQNILLARDGEAGPAKYGDS